jgi:hypothetical protein
VFSNCASLSILKKKKKKSVVPLSSNFKNTHALRARAEIEPLFFDWPLFTRINEKIITGALARARVVA